MAANTTGKARILYLMQELMENSDENNKLSTSDLISMLARNDINADRKTVYGDIEKLTNWGMDIIYSKEKPAGYYVGSRAFELPEVKLLVDQVLTTFIIPDFISFFQMV